MLFFLILYNNNLFLEIKGSFFSNFENHRACVFWLQERKIVATSQKCITWKSRWFCCCGYPAGYQAKRTGVIETGGFKLNQKLKKN